MPYHHYRTQGIFLKKADRSEADQILTIFTEKFGKIEVAAKSIRKITSKLRSGADVFYFSEIEFIEGKNQKILTDALAIDKFGNICREPQKLQIIYKIIEALDRFANQEARDEKIWRFLLQIFEVVENLEIKDSLFNFQGITANQTSGSMQIRDLKQEVVSIGEPLKMIYHYFLWNLLTILGYSPELNHCPVCRKKLLPETFFFVPDEGGVVCWQCFSKKGLKNNGPWFNIQVDTVKVLRVFVRDNWHLASKLMLGDDIRQNFLEISENYYSFLQESNS